MDLRIILDKSVVQGLSNPEVDSFDKHFLQVVPPILRDEILGDLSKQKTDAKTINRISGASYRISGNRALTEDHHLLILHSLLGAEIPMDGRVILSGQRMVRSKGGSIGIKVETPLEDSTIARWEQRIFTREEELWAAAWRNRNRNIYPQMYVRRIEKVGLSLNIPQTYEDLVNSIEYLVGEKSFQPSLLLFLYREFDIPYQLQVKINTRWTKTGNPLIKDFAGYAFFCIRAILLLAIGLTNPKLFKEHKHNRHDLEYCYYLPQCEIFSSKDNLHKNLVPLLLRQNQSYVDGDELKKDLNRLASDVGESGFGPRTTPPKKEDSVVFKLWKKHKLERSKLAPPKTRLTANNKPILTEEESRSLSFPEFIRKMTEKLEDSHDLSSEEIKTLRDDVGEADPVIFMQKKMLVSKERLLKMYPHLNASDLD